VAWLGRITLFRQLLECAAGDPLGHRNQIFPLGRPPDRDQVADTGTGKQHRIGHVDRVGAPTAAAALGMTLRQGLVNPRHQPFIRQHRVGMRSSAVRTSPLRAFTSGWLAATAMPHCVEACRALYGRERWRRRGPRQGAAPCQASQKPYRIKDVQGNPGAAEHHAGMVRRQGQ
jgi:hypothetical protein